MEHGGLREMRSLDTPGRKPVAPSRLAQLYVSTVVVTNTQASARTHLSGVGDPWDEVIDDRHFITQIHKYTSLGNQKSILKQYQSRSALMTVRDLGGYTIYLILVDYTCCYLARWVVSD